MGEVFVQAFGYTVAACCLDNSEEMVRERYSHVEVDERFRQDRGHGPKRCHYRGTQRG